MKKTILLLSTISLFNITNSFAQVSAQGVSSRGVLTFYKNNSDKKANVIGSEYIDEEFKSALVNGGTQRFQIRFNAYNNVMEYKKDNENLILTKNDNTLVEFLKGDTYELVSFTDKKGKELVEYLNVIRNAGKVAIYKFEKIIFVEARPAQNTYDTGAPAEYKKASDTYYLKINDSFSELPTKQKEYIKLFPNKEAEIKDFFKTNKINFKNNTDLIKLANFLNSIA